MKSLLRWALLAAAIFGGFTAWKYLGSTEYQVQKALQRFADLVQDRQVDQAMNLISKRFQGYGGISSNARETLDQKALVEGGWSSIIFVEHKITLRSSREAETKLCVTVKANNTSIDSGAGTGLYMLEADLAKEDDGVWRITSGEFVGPAEMEGSRCVPAR